MNQTKPVINASIQPETNCEQIIKVIHAAYKRYEMDPMPSSSLSETSATIEEELNNGILIFGAYVKDALVGVIKIKKYSDYFYFSRLAVIPTEQGKGIASSLVTYIEELAAKAQMNRVTCKVRKSESDNIRLYSKLGYQITKEEMSTSPLGYVMPLITMEKDII